MTYPRHLFKTPGPFRSKGVDYAVAGAADEDQEAALMAKGWHLTLADAQGVKAKKVEQPTDDSPPSRDELVQKAKELGIKGAHLMKDATLAERIREAL
jgi:hypothetical protein